MSQAFSFHTMPNAANLERNSLISCQTKRFGECYYTALVVSHSVSGWLLRWQSAGLSITAGTDWTTKYESTESAWPKGHCRVLARSRQCCYYDCHFTTNHKRMTMTSRYGINWIPLLTTWLLPWPTAVDNRLNRTCPVPRHWLSWLCMTIYWGHRLEGRTLCNECDYWGELEWASH